MPLRVDSSSPSPSPPAAARRSAAAVQSSDTVVDDSFNNDHAWKRVKLVTGDMVTKTGRVRTSRAKVTTREKAMQQARSIKRVVDMWVSIPQAVNVGRANETLEEYGTMDPSDDLYDEREKKVAELIVQNCGKNKDLLVKVYARVKQMFEGFSDYIDDLDVNEDRLFWQEVNGNADSGRNDDTGKLKDNAHDYVLKDGQLAPTLKKGSKEERGIYHPQLAREILPMSVVHKYGNDENFIGMAKAKKFKVKHNNAPAFLFDREMWDAENPDNGLFRGHFPVWVLRQIFFGPMAAKAAPGSKTRGTRKNNAQIAGVTKVTPEMIAYACVHARFYICTLEQFAEYDGEFSFKSFYYWILSFFERVEKEWVEETLEWWNEQMFGHPDDIDLEEEEDDDDETSFENILALQRARKSHSHARSQAPAASQTQPDSQYTQQAFGNQA